MTAKAYARRFEYRGGAQYGRSPLESILPEVRQIALAMERRREFGDLPAGVTVWRDVRSGPVQWRVLPDPAKATA